MKEAVFILLVVAALLAISAVRYRRQITTAIRFYKLLRGQVKQPIENTRQVKEKAKSDDTELLSCARCGRWVSRSEAIRMSGGMILCSIDCSGRPARARRPA